MKKKNPYTLTANLFLILLASPAFSQAPPVQEPSSDEVIQEALAGGVPLGRWTEGLLFEGIEPQPWLKSAANWFPGTEEIQPDEMRVIFMGTSPTRFVHPRTMIYCLITLSGG